MSRLRSQLILQKQAPDRALTQDALRRTQDRRIPVATEWQIVSIAEGSRKARGA